jgi:acetyl-CoA/propionyl-CoA/long-chain acyl-CoA carboxylase, biotin carboxylase, biotin carboxyl carrier protein
VRVARTCRQLGVSPVMVYSDVDAGARHASAGDDAVALSGTAPSETYLNRGALLDAAHGAGAEAIHPGYGFLSESADFAAAVERSGLTWIGPPPQALRALGDKLEARRLASRAGIPVVPGSEDELEDPEPVLRFAERHGYPVALKAAGGGGGRGFKVVRGPREVEAALASARREAEAYFGSSAVYVERYLDAPKHLEVQILAPAGGEPLWIGVRDCSLQRRHQKLVEECPPPRHAEQEEAMGRAAVELARASEYVNAGTVEMLVEPGGRFYFLEVNARLQVEHTVTEEVFGLDLVECQLRIAAGEPLGLSQDDLVPRGHAIECRINAEDPSSGFAPAPGRITSYREPGGEGVRVDSGYGGGDEVPAAYDSLIAKLITRGEDRNEARARMLTALKSFRIEGVATTIPAHLVLMTDPEFERGEHTTVTVERSELLATRAAHPALDANEEGPGVVLVDGTPAKLWHAAMAASIGRGGGRPASDGTVVAPLQGTVVEVVVAEGQTVAQGDPLLVLEAMKMETVVVAPRAGVVAEVGVGPGSAAGVGEVLVVLR